MILRDVVDRFDGFILDQFGVLHDGTRLLPGAVAALEVIRATGKAVVLVTNSAKPAAENERRLAQLGIPRDLYSALVSSGETARAGIAAGTFGPAFRSGANLYVIGRDGEDYGLAQLGVVPVDLDQAEGLLILGSDAPAVSLETYAARLVFAAKHHLPALCANPDLLMLTSAGHQPAPGAIAKLYADLGGQVIYAGKPHPAIYAEASRALGPIETSRVLAVGDSPEHDVAGAAAAGFTTALVRTGLSAGKTTRDLRCAGAFVPDLVLDGL